ncbi:MAG: Tetratricopeptide repeat protein [Candidatus Hinthialibacteria bacterium OLB16]|nr:MAG: Tetratricopeptide repeat protein [Candidatus Hinthialibacteria bacterium OLB16]
MRNSHFAVIFLCFVTAQVSFADVIYFGSDRRLDGHVVRRGRSTTNVKLLGGSTLTLENNDIERTRTEPFVAYMLKRGDYYLEQRKDIKRALETYQEALRLKPGDPEIQARLDLVVLSERITRCQAGVEEAREIARDGNLIQAIDIYEKLLPTAPREELRRTIVRELAETYAQLAYRYYDHSYFVGAEEMLRKAEQYNPNSPTLHFVLGRIHHVNRDWEAADKAYSLAEELDPNIPKLKIYRAEVRSQLKYKSRPIAGE